MRGALPKGVPVLPLWAGCGAPPRRTTLCLVSWDQAFTTAVRIRTTRPELYFLACAPPLLKRIAAVSLAA